MAEVAHSPLNRPATARPLERTSLLTSNPTAGWRHPATVLCLTALAYALLGLVVMPLATAPGFAAPLFPAAGVALAAVLVFGAPAWAGVALGAFAVNLTLAAARGDMATSAPLLAAGLALGATLQAGAGAWWVKRVVRHPLTLAEPRDVVLFFGAGLVSCLVNANLSTAALAYSGALPRPALGLVWLTWWVGDLLGVLVAAPVALTFIGQPRDAWLPRRASVGLTLALAVVLLALGVRQVTQRDEQRMRSAFERDASSAAFSLQSRLQEPLHALEAMHGVFMTSTAVTRDTLRVASQAWLRSNTLRSLGWAERVRPGELTSFEAQQRNDGIPNFQIFERTDGGAPISAADDKLVIRYIEPAAGNAAALGFNVLSTPQGQRAAEAAIASGQPAASGLFRLALQRPDQAPGGIVLYRAIYRGPAETEALRRENVAGVVFASLLVESQLDALASQIAPQLKLCLVDTEAGRAPTRMAGSSGCEQRAHAMNATHPLTYAGRRWELRVGADSPVLHGSADRDALAFTLIGVLAATMLGGFLLIVTGRTRRVETAVRERTAALESEVRERGIAEAALRESEQRFRSILDNVPIGMRYTDLHGQVIQTNPALRELTGYSEAELLELHASAYTHPDDAPQDAALTAQLARGEIPMYRRHQRYIAKGGEIVWVRVTVSLLRDAHGQPLRLVAVVENITEHLRLEEAEHAREVAESSNRAKSEFLSRMSHELRTPLNAMLGFAQLLELDRRHPLAAAQQPWVAQIQQAGWHLLEMINDVLDLSRIESGQLRLQTKVLNLSELFNASLSMVEGLAQGRRISVSTDLADGAGSVMGDATRVTQILTNLLSNAVKYNVEGGRIHVSSRHVGAERVEISVTDTGMGMTPEQLAQLFQPFNRLGRERSTQQEGTGIGLVIAQRLAELMGGSLHARSVTGQGSSFFLTLPGVIDPDTVRSDLVGLDTPSADYHRRIVHYVEDNETNVEVMRGILAQRPQVQMEVSINGLDSLPAMRLLRPDLILLDMHLPDISGLELLRHLKADPRMLGIPVVVVSADALAQQIDAALEAGASHYLTKPVSVAELLGVVDALLEQSDTRFG